MPGPESPNSYLKKHEIMRNKLLHLLMRFFQMVLVKKKTRIFFISFKGKAYSDNPRAISEKVYQLYGEQLEYIWAIDKSKNDLRIPNYVKRVKADSLKSFYYLCTSKIWVSNFCFPSWSYKSSEQYYIQTWHGDIAIKKILLDNRKRDYFFESNNMDLLLVGSNFGKRVMTSAFGYKGELLNFGCPRNDVFFSKNQPLIEQIRNLYGISEDTKILLYAPTFRKKYKTEHQPISLDLEKTRQILEKATNNKWLVMIRSHEENANIGFDNQNPSFLNVTSYPEMNELLLVTDVLISDYSSCVADFALTGKLVLLYQDDLTSYTAGDRDIYPEFYDSPFYKFTESQALYSFLEKVNDIDSKENCRNILRYYGSTESGKSSEKVATIIENIICG